MLFWIPAGARDFAILVVLMPYGVIALLLPSPCSVVLPKRACGELGGCGCAWEVGLLALQPPSGRLPWTVFGHTIADGRLFDSKSGLSGS